MDLAALSVAALILAILLSCTTQLNIGFVSIVLAWLIGTYLAGMRFSELAQGFPTSLFLTLVGVTLLFSQARANGTLERIALHAVRLCRGHSGLIPIMFFFITALIASIGAGNISAAALIAPIAMAVAGQVGISSFLMVIMVGNGANAGSLSPFAPTGVIVNGLMERMSLGGFEWVTYANNLVAHATVAFGGYFLLGGWKLFTRSAGKSAGEADAAPVAGLASPQSLDWSHRVTLGVMAALIIAVVFYDVQVGMAAFAGALLLSLLRMADDSAAVRLMPWQVIMMVSGVTVLISLLEKTGGMDLFTEFLARVSTQETVTGVVAFVTGLISAYSSTSGVVLPAFLPTVPGLVEKLGGGDVLAVASAMNVGAHLVDVSPLSTIGALCIAAAAASENYRSLFNKVLAWGLSMSVIGALLCYLYFGLLW